MHRIWRVYSLHELLAALNVERAILVSALHSSGWRRVRMQRGRILAQGWLPPIEWLPEERDRSALPENTEPQEE
jgi:hypothetical protein